VRVLFWGTPDFATPALRALLGEGFDVVGVVTPPDRPVGRSRSTPVPPPVKRLALDEGLPVLQPERPRGAPFVAALRALAPDASVVVAYGHLIPEEVLHLPRLGSFNIHASLLPALRGAAPIQGAILAGLAETGVTIMRMTPRLDAGPVLLQARTPIVDDETYGELALRLSELGALALIEALALVDVGQASETPQDEGAATYAPRITRDMTRVAWARPAAEVARTIRAFDPKPGAVTTLRGADVKLFEARPAPDTQRAPGKVVALDESGLVAACAEGAVRIGCVQPAGKRKLTPADWARGRGVALGDQFGET
jgi:methionyl-tRNA formyltransferase